MIIRRMCEGAVKCALRDFRREELTLRWAGGGVVRGSVGTESSGQASGATGYYQLTELSCCSVPRHPDSRKKGQGRAAPGGVLHGRDCPFGDCLRSLERDGGYCIGRSVLSRLSSKKDHTTGASCFVSRHVGLGEGEAAGGEAAARVACVAARPGKLNVYNFLLLTKPCLIENARVRRSTFFCCSQSMAYNTR